MKTDLLIEQIASQAQAVQPIYSPTVRYLIWLSASIVFVGLGVFVVGTRSDVATAVLQPQFLIQVVTLVALAFAISFSALFLSVPDMRSRWVAFAAMGVVVLWLLIFAGPLFFDSELVVGKGLRCLRNILMLGTPPMLGLFYLARKGYPIQKASMSAFVFMGGYALACLGTRFICPNDDLLHFFSWHCAPILMAGALGLLLAKTLFRFSSSN